MKRLLLGLSVLIALLAGGISVSAGFSRIHDPIAHSLQAAAEAAQEGNWLQAQQLAEAAQQRWEAFWTFTAAFADHAPMDEMDGLFAQLPIYGQQHSEALFPALCTQLAQLAQAIADSHRLRWWTLL